MGPLLAIFLIVSLNLAPSGTSTVTIDSYVVEGVGIYDEASRFVAKRVEGGQWELLDAFGDPWFVVSVDGPKLTLLTEAGPDQVDFGAALGLPDTPWWADDVVEPPGLSPLVLAHLTNGVDIELDGLLAAAIRW